ncbi:MAG: T9SS type A sorting domain-containing protein [Actinobacteria bacterium]|nr:T9SS type A sorting domain-containing protein [Actinomycetota bacterium]
MIRVVKKTSIALLVIFIINILLLLFIKPLNIYADSYDIGDTGPGGGTVFYSLPNGQCKEAITYDDNTYDWYDAVDACDLASIGGYDDWYLPEMIELGEVWFKLYNKGLGNFSDRFYWSADESDANNAQAILFYGGAAFFVPSVDKNSSSTSLTIPPDTIYGYYIIAVRSFMGDPQNTVVETTETEDVWVRNHEMTCYQVWINEDNNFEFVFWWEYANNNHVQIYDMAGNLVWETDFSKGQSHFVAELPDGMYTVKTFHEYGHILQEFVIGKP